MKVPNELNSGDVKTDRDSKLFKSITKDKCTVYIKS